MENWKRYLNEDNQDIINDPTRIEAALKIINFFFQPGVSPNRISLYTRRRDALLIKLGGSGRTWPIDKKVTKEELIAFLSK